MNMFAKRNVVNVKRWTSARPLPKMFPFGNVSDVAAAKTNDVRARAFKARFRTAAERAGFYREWGGNRSLMVAELVKATGLKKAELSKFGSAAAGAKFPTFEKIELLARAFRVRARWLATGEGPMQELSAFALFDALTNHPKLQAELKAQPQRWYASTLAEALHPETLEAKTRSDDEGTPAEGWAALLDDIEKGSPHISAPAVVSAAVAAEAGVVAAAEAGRARRLPRGKL